MLLQRITSPFFVACWLLATACTVGAFWQYEFTAGLEHSIPKTWPAAAKTGVPTSGNSLLMFVHPRCSCTQAGLRELRELLTDIPDGKYPSITFIVLQPGPLQPVRPETALPTDDAGQLGSLKPRDVGGWTATPTEAICRDIPGSQVVFDMGGAQARRFGITTSGTCLLYSASGTLLFSGGLTQSRGHSGPNRGRDLLTFCLLQDNDSTSIALQHHTRPKSHATFGCPLFSATNPGPL